MALGVQPASIRFFRALDSLLPKMVYMQQRIATCVARGIAEIHSQDGGKFVHGNIKSSNIFLNGCVSDLVGNMMRATFMPNAFCYAPEAKSTHSFSQESDVYSFGILLLELLTRKSPVHVPGGSKAVDLVKLVSSVKSKIWASMVVDADLLKHRAVKEQVIKILQIGISCVAKSPKKRPKMSAVVIMLEDLIMIRGGSKVSLEGKLVFVEDRYPTFAFEDVIKAYNPAHWRFMLDRAAPYKVIVSEIGVTFMVKRFQDVNVTYEEFLQNMEIIGRIRHENVAELRAYYYSNKDVLLVYYYDRPILSTFDSKIFKVTWERLECQKQLKIAVGAARGIAYIHQQDNCKLVHGNIKPSNIFTNGEGYGVVSTPGLTKVMNPTRRRTSAYSAPEIVKNIANISQACDVYSFGVVLLLQFFCGKQEFRFRRKWHSHQWNTNVDDDDGGLYYFVGRIQSISRSQWTVDPDISGPPFLDVGDQLLQLAMDCVAIDPAERPNMAKLLVRILEETRGIDLDSKRLIGSRLKNSLENLLPLYTQNIVKRASYISFCSFKNSDLVRRESAS